MKYVVVAKLHSNNDAKDEKILESYNKILATMKANGYDAGERVEITTNETAKMIDNIKEVAQKIKTEAGEVTGYFSIEFTGVEAQYADKNDREHAWEVYEVMNIGKIPDSHSCTVYFSEIPGGYYVDAWAYGFKTNDDWHGNEKDSHNFDAEVDLNRQAGGATIVPVLITDGDGGWNPQSPYITDVIVIYGGGQPESIVIDGRTYKQEWPQDLNQGAHGEYIYLYATRDYYDGRYLWLGGYDHKASGGLCCRVIGNLADATGGSENFSAAKLLNDPWNANGYDVVERVVPAYNTSGVYQDEAEFNKGAGGAFIKMILSYRKHD